MKKIGSYTFCLFWAQISIVSTVLFAGQTPPVDFTRDIQPIFAQRCYSCHGQEKQKNGLRLDRKHEALTGGDSGRVIVPGKSAESLLFVNITSRDPEKLMPPKGERLSALQIEWIKIWIDQGSPWPDDSGPSDIRPTHWSFVPPQTPVVPKIKHARWVRNPIDAFVLARLEREKYSPSPAADRSTLIRRLSLDLLGLPPTLEQIEAFVQDQRRDAYERLVDSFLSSPHFGERWGRHWLDLARYADSEGYQIDLPRPQAYHFRDWVIDALNRDLPFDEFTIEQIAGDLLPNATADQKIAAGFHRNTLMNHEDGTDREEFRCKAKVDRVSTTGTVWLGLTLGCAECHNHKYDPISQREFYQLYAFFNNAQEIEIPLAGQTKTGAMTFFENPTPAKAFIHLRGNFLNRGDEVQAGTPACLPPLAVGQESGGTPNRIETTRPNRLDFARWLVAPANPLTSRVAVNHLWQHLFGRGLVATVEDFGVQGEKPSHPELLDWLATEFIRRGWSRKEMIRLIVTSSTYRQASHLRPDWIERDPENILLARQKRFQVEAEVVRDLHLAASGLLNPRIGGESFYPALPADVKALGYAHIGGVTWVESAAPEKYRRGLYVFSYRTVPYPLATTFDAPDPNMTCARRARANTPLQALSLMNNALFFECAQALGRRLEESSATSIRQKIERGFLICFGRRPIGVELKRLENFYGQQVAWANKNPISAGKLIGSAPERLNLDGPAASVALAHLLMNLDEFVTRE